MPDAAERAMAIDGKQLGPERAGMSRPQTVWSVLGIATVGLTTALWLLDGRPAPQIENHSAAALIALEASDPLETLSIAPQADEYAWQGIVIHHSGSRFDSPETIEKRHHEANLASLGYHFVIGNGSGMDDGELFASERWDLQQPGAHTAGINAEHYNRQTIGICLVGDGERSRFTQNQIERLLGLVTQLQDRFDIPAEGVLLHREVAQTASPGRWFPAAEFRERLVGLR